jgi:hypothetical protein
MRPAPKLMNNPENKQSATMAPACTRWRWVVLIPSAAACGSASALRLARSIYRNEGVAAVRVSSISIPGTYSTVLARAMAECDRREDEAKHVAR